MSISWGRSQRIKFIAAGTLAAWSPPVLPAVYAITYKKDDKTKPKAHTVLYFGQADDLSLLAQGNNQPVLDMWAENGGSINDLYIFVHPMPGSSFGQRTNVHEQLVKEYHPDGNRYLN